jgi:pyridoxamine 5'-phosphate oxidase
MNEENIKQMRREYNKGSFNENNAKQNPFEQFRNWFNEAIEVKMLEPNAMTVATADKYARPSARVVLLKSFDERGFVFYTNYESRKAIEILENPQVSLLFYWDKLERQVRIEGKIEKTSFEESDSYFQTRPYISKIGAWASKQSNILKNRFTLIRKVAGIAAKYPINVPLPDFWGGYRVIPSYFEFWQGRESRLHDRMSYKMENNIWIIERLYP